MNIWDEIIENWQKYIEEGTPKSKALEGLLILKDLLPNIEKDHLLTSNCYNLAPWNGNQILETAKIIHFFKCDPKFEIITKRLINKFTYSDTFVELEIKYQLKGKFQTIFDVRVGNKNECDAVIKVCDGLIHCEITNLGLSKANLRLSRLFNELSSFVHFQHRLNWHIKVKDFGTDEDFEKAKQVLLGHFEEFNKLEFYKSHILIDKDKIFVKEGRIDGSLTGPPFIDDHLKQLQKRISNKVIQSSFNSPNLLIINISSPVYYFDKKHIKSYVNLLEDFISKNHPAISGIYLINRWMTFSDPITKVKKEKISGSYLIESLVNDDLISWNTCLILNKKSRINLTKQEVIALKNLFVNK